MEIFKQYRSLLFIIATSVFIASCGKSSPGSTSTPTVSMVSTFAGTGSPGAVNGTGTAASFTSPSALAFSNINSQLYVGDFGNNLIRTINLNTAAVNTYAGSGIQGFLNNPTLTAKFYGPANIALDKQGDLFVSDEENNAIREITSAGNVITVAGTGAAGFSNGPATTATFYHPEGIAIDANGDLYVVDGLNHAIRKITMSTAMVSTYTGTGSPGFNNGALNVATFASPYGLTLDANGNLYIGDTQNSCIRKIDVTTGIVSTFAGTGAQGFSNGPAATATFNHAIASAFDSEGNMYISDFDNHAIRKVSTSGMVSTYAGTGSQGATNGVASSASFYHPIGLALDGSGNLYVADLGNNEIRKITTGQ